MEAEKPKRSIQIMEGKGIHTMIKPTSDSFLYGKPALTAAEKKKMAEENRRERLPREEMLELIFKCFENRPYWSMKEIQEYTRQPAVYIREIIAELCDFIPRGPNKSLYSLKPEYKINHQTEEQEENQ